MLIFWKKITTQINIAFSCCELIDTLTINVLEKENAYYRSVFSFLKLIVIPW